MPEIVELNIGHFLIGEAIFGGLRRGGEDDACRHGSRPCARAGPQHDRDKSYRGHALFFWWSMIFSENRFPLFGIMLQ